MNKITGGALLVAGTCIGAGMLALPVTTAPAGLFISLGIIALCWLFMFYTALSTTNEWQGGEVLANDE